MLAIADLHQKRRLSGGKSIGNRFRSLCRSSKTAAQVPFLWSMRLQPQGATIAPCLLVFIVISAFRSAKRFAITQLHIIIIIIIVGLCTNLTQYRQCS